MSKVWYNDKTKEWVHDETGKTILASEIRTLPHHRKAVLALMGEQPRTEDGAPLPFENETQVEMQYVEKLLS